MKLLYLAEALRDLILFSLHY